MVEAVAGRVVGSCVWGTPTGMFERVFGGRPGKLEGGPGEIIELTVEISVCGGSLGVAVELATTSVASDLVLPTDADESSSAVLDELFAMAVVIAASVEACVDAAVECVLGVFVVKVVDSVVPTDGHISTNGIVGRLIRAYYSRYHVKPASA